MTGVLVSVVIPTYHREPLLDRCLAALVNQDFDPAEYEIIVVDDGNSDETRQLVDRWAERTRGYRLEAGAKTGQVVSVDQSGAPVSLTPASIIQDAVVRLAYLPMVRYIAVTGTKHGPAVARNRGWRSAVGAIIAFTDDDCIPQPDWLKMGMRAMESADGASGQVIVPLRESPTDYEHNARGLELSEFVTANCFYRKTALESVEGFDERFTTAWREDTDLFFSMLEKGLVLVHAPSALVIHPIRPATWGVSLRQQRKNLFNALLYKKHPVNYYKRLKATTPVIYYGILLALLLALTGWVTQISELAISGVAGWLVLVTVFCLRRLRGTSHRLSHVLEMAITSILIPPIAVFWRVRGAIRYRVLFF